MAGRVNERLASLLDAERRRWAKLDEALEEPLGDLADLVLAGGKRIRPAYCYWGWVLSGGDPSLQLSGDPSLQLSGGPSLQLGGTSAVGGDPGRSRPRGSAGAAGGPGRSGNAEPDASDAHPVDAAGCALELLHAFALVHDDVMDASPARRGAPSVWHRFVSRHRRRGWQGEDRRFGEAAAVLVGDMAMVLADRTLGPAPPAARSVWDTLRTELNMGQYLDVAGTARGGVTAAQARTIIEHKTAGYTVVRPLQLGAALAGRQDLAAGLDRHGRPVGTAFQLRDDVLGVFGDPTATGKPVGDDLRENKPTLLMALARDAATRAQRQVLEASGPDIDDEALAAVQQVLTDTGALAAVEREIAELLDTALSALESLPSVPAAQEALADLARYVAARKT